MEPQLQKQLLAFFKNFEQKSVNKNQTIIEPKTNKVFFLTEGIVRMYVFSEGKDEITLNIYKPYSIFPIPLIFDLKNNYIFDSLTNVEGYFAPKKDFRIFVEKNNRVLLDLVKRIYQGFDGFFTLIEALLLGDGYLRVIVALIIYARRFGKTDQNKIIFDWHLTHRQIASQTGLARESVTREIKKLQDKDLITYAGKKLIVLSLTKLEAEYASYLASLRKLPLDKL